MINRFDLYTENPPSFSVKQIEQRVVLHFFSIQRNSNKFYIMEFQEGSGQFSYRIYTEYGRMGSTPRRHERYYQTRFEAKKEFERILSAKRKKGYELIILDDESDEYPLLPQGTPFQGIKTEAISQSSPTALHTAFGKLSETQLLRGLRILTEIEEIIHYGTPEIIYLSNQFYSVIPVVAGNRIDRTCLLDTLEKVEAKKKWLKQMMTVFTP